VTRASMWIHLGRGAMAMALAWRAAHTVRERTGPSSTTLLAAEAGDVASVDYTWDKGTTRVQRDGATLVVSVDRELPPGPAGKGDKKADNGDASKGAEANADAGATAAVEAAAAPAPTREQQRFPGGKPVGNAVKALEPLRSKRTLGVVDDARLTAMGLAKPARTLAVTTRSGRSLVLELGDASFGSQGRYARVAGEPVVHLIDAAVVAGFEGGVDALVDKQPLSAELEQVRGYALRAGDRAATFVHVAREQPSKRHFARRDDTSAKDGPATKLFGTLRNLRGTKLADAAVADAAGSVVAAFAVEASEPFLVEIVERGDGGGHLARVQPWTWELSTTPAKELLDDVDAVFAP